MSDTITGLPELAEGEYWRVQRRDYRGLLFDPYFSAPYELRICRDVEEKVLTPRKWLWITTGYDVSTKTAVRVIDKDDIRAMRKGVERDPKDSPELWYRQAHDFSLTPNAIRETAARMIESRAESSRIKSLLGDYPPKKLAEQ